MMETIELNSYGLTQLSLDDSCRIRGGSQWDYALAEYVGVGIGYGVKKLWRAFRFLSENLYAIQSNPKVLYQ